MLNSRCTKDKFRLLDDLKNFLDSLYVVVQRPNDSTRAGRSVPLGKSLMRELGKAEAIRKERERRSGKIIGKQSESDMSFSSALMEN